ncbi:MAG: hypothetical protein RI897_914 [Verrucomicrobiota bacterium]|jgi:drug/metabolite transporter (DMT)-like permease
MTPPCNRIQPRATGAGLIAILLWSTTFALARSLTETLGPFTSAAAVYVVAAALLLPSTFRQWRTPIPDACLPKQYLLGCGGLFVAYTTLLYLAIGACSTRQQLLEIALVNYLWPVLTILLSVLLLRLKASPCLWPALVLALAGLPLVVGQDSSFSLIAFQGNLQDNPLSYGLAGTAALSWAAYSVLTRKWAPQASSGAVGLFILATATLLVPLAWASNESPQWTSRAILEVLIQGAITASAYALWDHAMRLGNLTLVTSASYLTPLLSTAISCYYLDVTPSKALLYGAASLVTGSLLSYLSVRDTPYRNPDKGPAPSDN